jgi:lipoic acid synthetase
LGWWGQRNHRIDASRGRAGIDILTIGQYLRPSVKHAEIKKYYHPDEFAELREIGRGLGIRWVFSGPLVRSSYHAEDVFEAMMKC